jgi:hypothetical protein
MVSALVLLLAVGLLAIGASGVLSVAFRATLGDRFVAADLPGVTYTAARCRDLQEYHPEQPTCDRAAAAHHADEVETYGDALALDAGNGGAGQWLSAAVVSLVVALAFGREVLRALSVRTTAVAG